LDDFLRIRESFETHFDQVKGFGRLDFALRFVGASVLEQDLAAAAGELAAVRAEGQDCPARQAASNRSHAPSTRSEGRAERDSGVVGMEWSVRIGLLAVHFQITLASLRSIRSIRNESSGRRWSPVRYRATTAIQIVRRVIAWSRTPNLSLLKERPLPS
jgi:hypothetical protein